MLYFWFHYLDKDGDEAKDDQSADDLEAMDIGDVELKAEASILTKEVKAVLVLIIRLLEMNQASKLFVLFFQATKEEEMTEEEKAAQKAKPVATNPIPGTPW